MESGESLCKEEKEEYCHIRVWSCVGHGQEEWTVVAAVEVLVTELVTVDGLATGTL